MNAVQILLMLSITVLDSEIDVDSETDDNRRAGTPVLFTDSYTESDEEAQDSESHTDMLTHITSKSFPTLTVMLYTVVLS